MDAERESWANPLVERYAGRRMVEIFGRRRHYGLWRRIWIELARAQMELGLAIRPEQVAELEATRERFDWERIAAIEGRVRHDVMAHIKAWAEIAPGAGGVLHLGATSMDVGDNADLVQYREALGEVARGLAATLAALADFALRWRDLPCLGYTHFQAAQLVTVGRRAVGWAQDFLDDLGEVERLGRGLKLRGLKGATGTQASYLGLFGGDESKVRELERRFARALGFEETWPVTTQTYPRKVDSRIAAVLAGVAESAARFATDVRLLAGLGELSEPMEAEQVGSSAMPYKRNPVRCERIVSLARLVGSLATSPGQTASAQWLERTLDDSANRRIVLPELFLAVHAILRLAGNVARGLAVRPVAIARRVREMLPFLAVESVLAAAAGAGGDRQALHEALRRHAAAAWERVERGETNDFADRVKADPAFSAARRELDEIIRPERYVGRAPAQVDDIVARLAPALAAYPEAGSWETDLIV